MLKEAFVIVAAGVCLAGPVAAVVLALSPPAWRTPAVAWGILLGSMVLVAAVRRRD